MALLEVVTTEQILALIQQLPAVSKRTIFEVLRQELEGSNNSEAIASSRYRYPNLAGCRPY